MKIYAADCSVLKDEKLFAECFELMSEKRKQTINQYKAEKDRMRSLGAGMLLNLALAETYPEVPLPPELDFQKDGKPLLTGFDYIHFNLSHSGTYAVCALDDSAIGIDIERIKPAKAGIAARFFSAEETEFLKTIPNEDQKAFFVVWTRKEAFLKALGKGLRMDLRSFSVCKKDCGVQEIFEVLQEGRSSGWFCTSMEFGENYIISTCSQNADFPSGIKTLNLAFNGR
ncbi:MAG: 4'-phosphopantetheinyl transferase superfamily protein [Spirochaetaceae bacterium]|nr:4'-phosphopantetheinyl transferase superfamily protein [Spirochaetaceae bacterium]